MSRPTTRIAPRLHYKHGAYYHVVTRRRPAWIRLGKTLDESMPVYLEIEGVDNTNLDLLLRKAVRSSRHRAKAKGIPHSLTMHQVFDMCGRSKWRCAITGLSFSAAQWGFRRRPWAPSLDRIDSLGGYTQENTRIVCSAVNYAMNEWGLEVLNRIARAMLRAPSVDSVYPFSRRSAGQLDELARKCLI